MHLPVLGPLLPCSLEELSEKRQSMVQRVKAAQKERDALSGDKAAAEEYLARERECLGAQSVLAQVLTAKAKVGGGGVVPGWRLPSYEWAWRWRGMVQAAADAACVTNHSRRFAESFPAVHFVVQAAHLPSPSHRSLVPRLCSAGHGGADRVQRGQAAGEAGQGAREARQVRRGAQGARAEVGGWGPGVDMGWERAGEGRAAHRWGQAKTRVDTLAQR